jgi:hypothetical protein
LLESFVEARKNLTSETNPLEKTVADASFPKNENVASLSFLYINRKIEMRFSSTVVLQMVVFDTSN